MSESELIKDLIEQPAKVYIDKNDYQQGFIDGVNQMVKELSAERQLGEWLKDKNRRKCSVCGSSTCWTDDEGNDIPDKYCPNCGADMREQTANVTNPQ